MKEYDSDECGPLEDPEDDPTLQARNKQKTMKQWNKVHKTGREVRLAHNFG